MCNNCTEECLYIPFQWIRVVWKPVGVALDFIETKLASTLSSEQLPSLFRNPSHPAYPEPFYRSRVFVALIPGPQMLSSRALWTWHCHQSFNSEMSLLIIIPRFYKYFEYTIKWQLEDTGSAAFQRRQRQQLSQQQHRGLVQQR